MQKQQANFKTFIVFWLSQTVSQLGSAMTGYALVLWVYGQTNSALSVSLLTLCSYAPYVLVSVFAGGFVDRHRKKSIMLCADTVAFLCTLLIAALLLLNRLSVLWIYLVNAITGFMNAFQSPASAVANGRLVPQDKLTKMSGLQSIFGSAVSLASPMLAAFLMSTFGIASVLLADVGTFLFAAGVLLFFIRIPGDDAVNRVQKRGFETPFAGLREGLAFLKQDAAVRTMILVFAALNFFSRISYENILSPMVLSRSGSRQVLGLVSGILGFGGVIGGILAACLPQPKNLPRRIFLPGILSFLFGDLLMGAGCTPLVWALAAVGGSLPIPVLDSGGQYLLYTHVPKEVQGRIFAVRNALQFAAIPAGIFLGGVLADRAFEPFMAGTSLAAQAFAQLVGQGTGSGMAVMILTTGTCGLLCCTAGYIALSCVLKKQNGMKKEN